MSNFKNEYSVFFNGVTWTCEIKDDNGEVLDYSTGDNPLEALDNALKIDLPE